MNINIPDKLYKFLILVGVLLIAFSIYKKENSEKFYFSKIYEYKGIQDSLAISQIKINDQRDRLIDISQSLAKTYNDYCINKVKKKKTPNPNKPTKFSTIANLNILNPADTYTLNSLIDNVSEIINSSNHSDFEKGLKMAKVFRNKEGHVAVLWHKADRQNYTDIENCITEIYDNGFDEKLNFKISFLDGESAIFSIS